MSLLLWWWCWWWLGGGGGGGGCSAVHPVVPVEHTDLELSKHALAAPPEGAATSQPVQHMKG